MIQPTLVNVQERQGDGAGRRWGLAGSGGSMGKAGNLEYPPTDQAEYQQKGEPDERPFFPGGEAEKHGVNLNRLKTERSQTCKDFLQYWLTGDFLKGLVAGNANKQLLTLTPEPITPRQKQKLTR